MKKRMTIRRIVEGAMIAAICSYLLRDHKKLAPMPPVIANGLIIGAMLHFVYGVSNLAACMAWVAIGEMIACYVLGYPLIKLFERRPEIFGNNGE